MAALRSTRFLLKNLHKTGKRSYASATPATPQTSPFAPRHFMSIADLTPLELSTLVRNAQSYKTAIKSGSKPAHLQNALAGETIALMFSKRSTRTRVSSEAAITHLGGQPMFLGSNDIQLGVNESLYDTSVIISSMTKAMVARVGPHSDIAGLAKASSVPVINALSDDFHPLQTVADFLAIVEAFPTQSHSAKGESLGLEGLKIAWVGDCNNVLYDLAIGSRKLGVNLSVACPKKYSMPSAMRDLIQSIPSSAQFVETEAPEEAIAGADIIVTDTWISMGWEDETRERLQAFEGYQITEELCKRAGAKEDWRFMHCLPRHQEEVNDEVFYGPRSLVFPEGENRLWGMISVLEAFVLNQGKIVS